MASELFKNKALIQRLKEPDVPAVNFNLADSAKDYSIESIIEEISTPTDRVVDLADDLTPGPLREELKGTFDPKQETYEEYLRRINARYGGRAKPKRGLVDEPGSYAGELGQKYLYKYGSGYEVKSTRGNIYKSFPKDKLKEAKAFAKKLEEKLSRVDSIGLGVEDLAKKLGLSKGTIFTKKSQDSEVFKKIKKYFNIKQKGKTTPARYVLKEGLNLKNAIQDIKSSIGSPGGKGVKKATYGGKETTMSQVKNVLLKSKKPLNPDQIKELLPKMNTGTILNNLQILKNDESVADKIKRFEPGAKETAAKIRQTVAETNAPFMKAIRDQLVMDPDSDTEDLAKALFGDKKYNAVKGTAKQIELDIIAERQLPKFLALFSKGATTKTPGFKDISPDKLGDIIESLETRLDEFGSLDSGDRRRLMFSIADLKRNLPERATETATGFLKEKGKQVDEVAGVSATYNKAPGYIEATQVIDSEINQLKGKQIDSPFSKEFQKVLDGDYSGYKKYNQKAKAFAKKHNVDVPIIKIGENLQPEKFISNFKDFSPEAQKNIKQIAKDKGVVIQTKSKPLFSFLELGSGGDTAKYLAALGCPTVTKAMGGRIGFQEGTTPSVECIKEGAKKINSGKIKSGAEARNFAKFANTAMEIGKISGKGLRAVAKFGVIPEMIIIGADTTLRMGSGAKFDEAILRALDYIPGTGDLAGKADALELRRIDPVNAPLILGLKNFYDQKQKLDSLEQQEQADLALAGDDFAETNIGMTEQEIKKYYEPRIKEQESKVFESSISEPEELFALAKQAEFEDKRGILYKQSLIGETLDKIAEIDLGAGAPALFRIKKLVDLFDTKQVEEPDVSAQALKNYLADKDFSEEEKKFLRDTTKTSQGAKALLETLKQLEAGVNYPEGSVREKNLQDEERRLLLEAAKGEAAKGDLALAERYFGSTATFGGEPIINRTDLEPGEIPMYDEEQIVDDINRFKDFQMNRGIYSIGGRIGFKDGPKNPGRRVFLKLMTGIMALPFVGKFIKPAAPVVQKLTNTTTKMPDWFPNLIEKVMFKSQGKKVDADIMLHEVKELPGIKVYRQGDGKIRVEGTNEYGKEYQIDYEPPGYEVIEETGKSYKTKGDFSATEDVPVSSDPDGNMDFDIEVLDDLDQILGSDTRIMEEYATGKTVEKMKSGEFAVGKAEADMERAAEEMAESAEYYDEIN